MKNEKLGFGITGHVHIVDKNSGEVLLDKHNAIHNANMAKMFARALAKEDNAHIYGIALGNGGTNILPDFSVQYLPPNTTGSGATLYNETYSEIVDDTNVGVGTGNSVVSSSAPAPSTASITTVTLELTADEPAGQATSDSESNPLFEFDELGLISADPTPLLLSHIVFNPIAKTANRSILITYTLTISVDNAV